MLLEDARSRDTYMLQFHNALSLIRVTSYREQRSSSQLAVSPSTAVCAVRVQLPVSTLPPQPAKSPIIVPGNHAKLFVSLQAALVLDRTRVSLSTRPAGAL
jgi:hypothetical protein